MSDLHETRWAMGLGIHAGRALARAERALSGVQATRVDNDWNCVRGLRDARLELNHLAREISRLVDELEKERGQ